MTELKRPERYVQFESIKPELREITEFYTRKTADYQYRLKQLNEYADALENEILVLKETHKIEVLLDDTAKPLVVVPHYVADFIEVKKGKLKILGAFREITQNHGGSELYRLVFTSENSQELFAKAWIYGYTVEKPKEKLYFVKLPGTPTLVSYMCKSCSPGEIGYHKEYSSKKPNEVCFSFRYDKKYSGCWQRQFTELEIKAIDKRFWAFAVPVEEAKK